MNSQFNAKLILCLLLKTLLYTYKFSMYICKFQGQKCLGIGYVQNTIACVYRPSLSLIEDCKYYAYMRLHIS